MSNVTGKRATMFKTHTKCNKLRIDIATTVAHSKISMEHGAFYTATIYSLDKLKT